MLTEAEDPPRDAAGVVHDVVAAPRIVSLVPSLTELLFALGLGPRVVGRTGFCVEPRDRVRAVAKVGGTKDVDLDKVAALAPTHVIVNVDENRRETAEALRGVVPHVVVTHPLVPDDNLGLYRLFGRIFACSAQAEAIGVEYRAARADLAAAMAPLREEAVLYLVWREPWFTVARSTYISGMLGLARWSTLPDVDTPRYPEIDDGDDAWAQATSVLLSTEPYRFAARDVVNLRRSLGERKVTPRRIALVDGQMISWYGSRAAAGLRYLAKTRLALQ